MKNRMIFSAARRHMLKLAPCAALPWSAKPAVAAEPVPDVFPQQSPALVREMVTVAHGNFKRVKELVDARPALAKAAIDWGFGDWEDALGAASHIGNRGIAEYLIANGARPTLFSATMLGHLDIVKAFVAAQPGVQKIAGPHSISLLAHAKAGGKQAEAVLQYLESLGDAGSPERPVLSAGETTALVGVYSFGPTQAERIEITEKNGQLTFTRTGSTGRGLLHVSENTFHPAGASAVRIQFSGSGSSALLTVHDPEVVMTARRVPQELVTK